MNNIIQLVFTKHMGCFSDFNDFEYTFNVENDFLIASFKHSTRSKIEYGEYDSSAILSKKLLEDMISKSNLLNWTDSMTGALAYDAASWDIDIYLKCSEKIGALGDYSIWRQSIYRNENKEFNDTEYLKLRCWGQFHSLMLRTLWGTYLDEYINSVPKNIYVKEIVDPLEETLAYL